MAKYEIEEILTMAKVGFWNYKMIALLVPIDFIAIAFYMITPFMLAPINYSCNELEKGKVKYSNDHCYYSVNGSEWKTCSEFTFSSTSEFDNSYVSEFSLVCNNKPLKSLYLGCISAGLAIANLFGAFLMDRFGRKTFLVSNTIIMFCCYAYYRFIPTVRFLWLITLFDSFASVGVFTASSVLLTECLPQKLRAAGNCLAEGMNGLGIAAAAVIMYFARNWQSYQTFRCLVPSIILVFSTILFVDESPRWLYKNGKHQEFGSTVKRMFFQNLVELPEDLKDQLHSTTDNAESSISNPESGKFWLLFRTWRTARNFIVIVFLWSFCISVYLGLIIGPGLFDLGSYSYYIFNGVVEVPGSAIAVLASNFLGRRCASFVSVLVCSFSLIMTVFLTNYPIIKLFFATCGKMFVTSAFIINYFWVGELMPTSMRGTGLGITYGIGGLISIATPEVIELLEIISIHLPIYFLSAFGLVVAVSSLVLPETLETIIPDDIECYEKLALKNNLGEQYQHKSLIENFYKNYGMKS